MGNAGVTAFLTGLDLEQRHLWVPESVNYTQPVENVWEFKFNNKIFDPNVGLTTAKALTFLHKSQVVIFAQVSISMYIYAHKHSTMRKHNWISYWIFAYPQLFLLKGFQ